MKNLDIDQIWGLFECFSNIPDFVKSKKDSQKGKHKYLGQMSWNNLIINY